MARETIKHEWLWNALHDGQHKVVMRLAPQDFDWKSSHPVYGTPLMSVVHEMIMSNGTSGYGAESEQAHLDEMVRWCMRMGADPRDACSGASGCSVGDSPPKPPGDGWVCYRDGGRIWWHYEGFLGSFWCIDDEEMLLHEYDEWTGEQSRATRRLNISAEKHANHSAISLTIAIKQKLRSRDHATLLGRARHLLDLFSEYEEVRSDTKKMLVERSTINLWANVLDDASLADVHILAGDSRFPAHAVVLCNVSQVLKAMLHSDMQEGRRKQIDLEGVKPAAVRLLLVHVYTGCFEGNGRCISDELEALSLAHRWQIDNTVQVLERSLVAYIREELQSHTPDMQAAHLSSLSNAAKLHNLGFLAHACCEYLANAPAAMKRKVFLKAKEATGRSHEDATSSTAKRLRAA